MLASIIGTGMKAIGSVVGGILNSANARQELRQNERKKAENQAWYDKRYNEDATQRADAQRLLSYTEDKIKQRNKAAEGQSAVMGASTEEAAVAKEANNKVMADAVSAINAQGEARKDNIESTYMQRKDQLENEESQLRKQKMAGITQAVQGVADAAGNIANLGAIKAPQVNVSDKAQQTINDALKIEAQNALDPSKYTDNTIQVPWKK